MPWATARSAAFAEAKAVNGGRARTDAVAPVKSIDPPPDSMRRAASRPVRKPPKQHNRQTSSKNASSISSSGRNWLLPAL